MRALSLLCLVTDNESCHKIHVTTGLISWQLLYIKTIFKEALVEINFSFFAACLVLARVGGREQFYILIDLNSTL